MPVPLSYTAAPDTIQDTNVMLTGIFYKVGIKTRQGNSLTFQLMGKAMWQRDSLRHRTCKGGAHQNFLPPIDWFPFPTGNI